MANDTSKITIGPNSYDIKDAEARAGLNNLYKNCLTDIVRASGAWSGTQAITMGTTTMYIDPKQNIARFSHYWTGDNAATYPYGMWQWITAVTNEGIYYNLINNDGEPDCFKAGDVALVAELGDAWVGTDFENTEVWAQILGLDSYRGYAGSTNYVVGHHIDWRFIAPWDVDCVNTVDNNNAVYRQTANFTGDGTTTTFYWADVGSFIDTAKSVTIDGNSDPARNHTFDYVNECITFKTAPANGAEIIITGTGSECPWMCTDLYAFLNAKRVASPATITFDKTKAHKSDYTSDTRSPAYGAKNYYFSGAIVPKILRFAKRYSSEGLLADNNDLMWDILDNFWLPTEVEFYGMGIFGGNMWQDIGAGSSQYPLYKDMSQRTRSLIDDDRRNLWLLNPASGYTNLWTAMNRNGYAMRMTITEPNVYAEVCFRTGTTFTINPNWN